MELASIAHRNGSIGAPSFEHQPSGSGRIATVFPVAIAEVVPKESGCNKVAAEMRCA